MATGDESGWNMDKKYNHMINRPRPVSPTRPRMSLSRRAAQFAPFAALTGFDGVIRETARQTEAETTLEEEEIGAIDRCLRQLKQDLPQRPVVRVRFFCPDGRKSGGAFETRRGIVVKIDEYLQNITLQNGENIPFRHIVQLLRE